MKKHDNLTDALINLDQKAAELTNLVLISQNIEVVWEAHDGLVDLIIEDACKAPAWDALTRFYDENHIPSKNSTNTYGNNHQSIHKKNSLPPITLQGKAAAAGACLVLCTIHAATIFYDNHDQVVHSHGASALYILLGEYERSITALMLHTDISHLTGNILGMLVLGSVICSLLGPGRGMFLIVLSGAVGNLLNAFMYRRVHLSIGASTAVMGAVGILTAWQLQKKINVILKPHYHIDINPSVVYPLGAGAALVGMFSGGENTDVSAHAFGFLSGLVETLLFLWIQGYYEKKSLQMLPKNHCKHVDSLFLILVIVIILLAWIKIE